MSNVELFIILCLSCLYNIRNTIDKDNDEGGNALDFVSLSIDGVGIEIPGFVEVEQEDGNIEKQEADRSQIKLGILSEAQTRSLILCLCCLYNIRNTI
jgi:hypothetical protein